MERIWAADAGPSNVGTFERKSLATFKLMTLRGAAVSTSNGTEWYNRDAKWFHDCATR